MLATAIKRLAKGRACDHWASLATKKNTPSPITQLAIATDNQAEHFRTSGRRILPRNREDRGAVSLFGLACIVRSFIGLTVSNNNCGSEELETGEVTHCLSLAWVGA